MRPSPLRAACWACGGRAVRAGGPHTGGVERGTRARSTAGTAGGHGAGVSRPAGRARGAGRMQSWEADAALFHLPGPSPGRGDALED